MDKYELRIIMLTGALLVIFLVAVLRGVAKYATDIPECIPYDEAYLQPDIKEVDEGVYQVFMLAQMWSFEPSEIYLPVGAEVDFYLSSKDVVHGLHIADKSVNMMAVPGGINKTTVSFNQPGVYPIVCHEYCGSGHQHMKAEVIVNYPTN
jgi:cytochrome c oxidase subunit 2